MFSALPLSLQQIRHITALGYLDVEDAFEHLADCADDSGVTLNAFAVCLTNLAAEFHGHVPPLLASIATALFRAFDQDRVEFAELAAGLSVLCKGTRQAKVQAAFSLYDYNSDGYISMDEMTRYLTAVFRVLYVLHPNMAADTGVSAVELGQLTADEAFAFQPNSRRLSLAEFAAWFAKHEPNTLQAAFVLFDLNGDGSISLEEMTQYLTSVFRVLFELSDQPRQLSGVSPVELATVTAAQAFHHVDLNPDGRIRLDEFKRK
ncbi:hypothetical protein DYB36_011874 [Aphanomyces astaci]|uniref:EF-hand domain-containing protein n=1 Tax=Aphanomyces astaci TaxID=112090 RepID=A0A397BUY6_APHAT|nr:hypothetical protein DYB36_011874 [Aphanomyces astaci]